MPIKTARSAANSLLAKKMTLSTAESCTGGMIASSLTDIAGSSKFFAGGVIAYSNRIKVAQLKIPKKIIDINGAVSRECAIAMAKNIRRIFKTDIGLSVTGIAGPSGGMPTKPVGLVYIAIANKNKSICKKLNFKGTRKTIKINASISALNMLRKFV